MATKFCFDEPMNKQIQVLFVESVGFRAIDMAEQASMLREGAYILRRSGFRQIQKQVVDFLLQDLQLRPKQNPEMDTPITEVIVGQDDIVFVAPSNFQPLNKMKQLISTPVVQVLVADHVKEQIRSKLVEKGLQPQTLKSEQSSDPSFLGLVNSLMETVVAEMVQQHRVEGPPVLSVNDTRCGRSRLKVASI